MIDLRVRNKGDRQEEIVNFYVTKPKNEIEEHVKFCIDRAIKTQYRSFLRDVQTMSDYVKQINDNWAKLDKTIKKKVLA